MYREIHGAIERHWRIKPRMYRPEGYKNPHKKYYHAFVGVPTVQDAEYEAFEAGAEAMLEGLRKMGTHTNVADDGLDIKGWRVFIPEGKE